MLLEIKELKKFADELSAATRRRYLKKLNQIQRRHNKTYTVILPNGDTRMIKGLDSLSMFLQLSPKTIKTYLCRGAGKFTTNNIVVQRED